MIIIGNPTLISTNIADGSSASLIISSGIDSTYSSYMFVFTDMHTATASKAITFQTGATYDTDTTTAPYVAYNQEDGGGAASAFEGGIAWSSQDTMVEMHRRMSNDSDACMAGIMILFDPSSTTHHKYFYYSINHMMDTSSVATSLTVSQGQIKTTSAITQIKFSTNGVTTLFSGTIQLYGIT